MPTILNQHGFRFFFYSNEHEPIHIHVEKGDFEAKYNLIPVNLVKNYGMKNKDLAVIEVIISENQGFFIEQWKKYFSN